MRIAIVVAVMLIIVGGVWAIVPPRDAEQIYINMVIHGVQVGGMTSDEAEAALTARFAPELSALTIAFTLAEENIATHSYDDFGAWFDFTEVVEAARVYSNTRNLRRRIARLFGRPQEINDNPIFRFDPARIDEVVREIAAEVRREPVNARFTYQAGGIVVVPGTMGRAIDTAAAVEETTRAVTQLSGGTVALSTQSLRPRYTQSDLGFAVSKLGTYSTPATGNDARSRNVARAAGRIHNQFLLPGEVFSAGTIIGAHLPNSGYEAALVLVRGEPVQDVGGGVCQVATTLYNAVLRAELTVLQRHNHSAPVSYADMGFDATLAGTWYDLKFKNSTNQPLLITAQVYGGRLHVTLHGFDARPAGRTIRFTSERTATTQPDPCKEIIDPTLAPGERVRILAAAPGYTYEVFKHVYLNGTAVERVSVNTSTYRPLQGVVNVGAE